MKIQEKLLFLLFLVCVASISASSYGMQDEEPIRPKKIEFDALRYNNDEQENAWISLYRRDIDKNIKSFSTFLISDKYEVGSVYPSKSRNPDFATKLGAAIGNSRIDIITTEENGASYAYVHIKTVLNVAENHTEKALMDQKANLERMAAAKKLEKRKSFWHRWQVNNLLIGAVAGIGLLKLYNKWVRG